MNPQMAGAKKATAKKTAKKASARQSSAKRKAVTKKAPAKKAPAKKAGAAPARRTKAKTVRRPDIEIDPDVLEFIEAIDRFKKAHNRPFPSWSEVLHVVKSLGYRRR